MPGCQRPASMRGPRTVCFLNEPGSIVDAKSWNDPTRSKLWLYQLHYFDDLCAADAPLRSEWHRDLIARWIAENPQGQGVGWEPYPLSLRVANWIKWCLAGNSLDDTACASLVEQVRYLLPRLEYHLLGNHLLENLKALVIAGCFFEGSEATEWRTRGLRELKDQVAEQILPDGGHYELTPMYHGLVLEGLLDVMNVMQVYDLEAPQWLVDACRRMTAWGICMSHPDSEWAQFNDTALNFAARAEDLADYFERLSGIRTAEPSQTSVLPDSGFVRATRGDVVLFADVGNLGPDCNPGHGHADTFTFELSFRGRRLIVDTGVSVYAEGPVRLLQRSTRAHNTVEIDHQDSSEVWSAFRVARRARVRSLQVQADDTSASIAAEHDGYRRLRGRPVHRREWKLTADFLHVSDLIGSAGRHELRSFVHLHPRYVARLLDPGTIEILTGERVRVARFRRGTWAGCHIDQYEYAAGFGQREPAQVLVLKHPAAGETELSWSLEFT